MNTHSVRLSTAWRRFDDLLLHLCVEPVAADGFAKAVAVVSANADADAPTVTVAEYAAAVQVYPWAARTPVQPGEYSD